VGSFERARVEELPRWLQGPVGEAYQRVLGRRQDAALARRKEVIKATLPATAPDDALPLLAADYMTEQAPPAVVGRDGESNDAFRERLGQMVQLWGRAGTPRTYKDILATLGVLATAVTFYRKHEATIGGNAWYSQVYVLVDSTAGPWTQRAWGGVAAWGSGAIWGCDITVSALWYLRREIRRRKGTHAFPVAAYLWLGGTRLWGVPETWGGWTYGSDTVAMRAKLGRVWTGGTQASFSGGAWHGAVRTWGQRGASWQAMTGGNEK